MNNNLLTLQEVADVLKVSYRTVLKRIKKGNLQATKVGGQWRVFRKDLDAYISGRHETVKLKTRNGKTMVVEVEEEE